MTQVFLEQHRRTTGAGRLWLWIETIAAIVLLSLRLRVDQTRIAWITNPERNRREFPWSELNFLDQRERTRQLSSLAAFTATSATFGGETP